MLQRAHPELSAEKQVTNEGAKAFRDEELPFDIAFHCDMFDPKNRIAWEIKPVNWFVRNIDYCIAQASGYKHFLDARAVQFYLYINRAKVGDDVTYEDVFAFPYNPPYLYTWPELRAVTKKSMEMLGR